MTYIIETYGCEMNLAESAAVEQIFIARGFSKASHVQLADVVVINTCSVRGSAEERIFGRLGFFTGLKKVREARPDAKRRNMELAWDYVKENGAKPVTVIVMGCMAERLYKSLKKDWPCVDYVVGTFGKTKFEKIIRNIEEGKKPFVVEQDEKYVFASNSYEVGAFSTFVPIMHGCNNFCTYCIVPYVRGRETSRPLKQILCELDFLSSRNVREITLLGQNVNSYDCDGLDFPDLLHEISNHLEKTSSTIEWIRFESSHPKDFSDKLIDEIASNRFACRGIHLAVQHGSSEILRKMNRHYTREDYLVLVKKLREKIPEVELSTDVMAGFPGETEEDFESLCSLMDEVCFETAFMYYYNPREGTPACTMSGQIPLEVKKKRLQKIIDMQLENTQKVMKKRVGKTVRVLADIVTKDSESEILGKTEQNERVAFKACKDIIGTFVNVRITGLNGNTYRGEMV